MFSALTNRFGLNSASVENKEDNEPPPFPLPNSIQRSQASKANSGPTIDIHPPESDEDEEGVFLPSRFLDPQELLPPARTTKKPPRVKVAVKQGYSQLDWHNLQRSGQDLRGGVTELLRVTPSMLAQHKSKTDCWQAYNGRVYNVTEFLNYHPGGVAQLMRAAGKDGTELFMKTHAWVNLEYMLDGCLIGVMVREE